jgi:hypothetical protein
LELAVEVQGTFDHELALQNTQWVEVSDYWEKVRGGRSMPSRRDIDPLHIPAHLLPLLDLVDVVWQPALRFR